VNRGPVAPGRLTQESVMSRIGKKPVTVPAGVKISLDPNRGVINVEGPKGKLSYEYRPEVAVRWDESEKRITFSIPDSAQDDKEQLAYWGTVRARVQCMVDGVTKGYLKKLEVVGVGWNAQAQGKTLRLNIGFCHPVDMAAPPGVEFAVANNIITITGPDKHAVGQFAANVRAKRPPEPYNGKGIKYVGETIIRKEGKVFGA
jgi:large subunit ribosomal protein L6